MKHTAFTILVRLMAVLAGLVSSIATARYLGPEGRGQFFFWSTIAALVVQFGNFGLHASNTYLHARKSVKVAVLGSNSLVAAVVTSCLLTGAVVAVMAFTRYPQASDPWVASSLLLLAFSGLYSQLGTNLFVAMDRLVEFNLLELATKAFVLLAMLAVLSIKPDPIVLLVAVGVSSALAAGAVLWRLVRTVGFTAPDLAVFRMGLPYGLRAFLIACLAALLARLNAIWLQPVLTPDDYGAWSIAAQVFDVLTVVPASIALVLLPKMMRSQNPSAMLRTNAWLSGGIMLFLLIAFAMVGDQMIVLLYGKQFLPAYGYLLWGAPGLVALSVITILSQYLATMGMPRSLIALWTIAAMLHAAIAQAVIPMHGATGAMASLSITYVATLALMLGLVKHTKGKNA